MDRTNKSGGSFFLGLIFFVLAAATGVMLLIATLVVWLSALTGSLIAATLIIGGFCFLLAGVIYLLALRAPIARIQEQIDTVYDVANAAKTAYRWVTHKIDLFLQLFDFLRA